MSPMAATQQEREAPTAHCAACGVERTCAQSRLPEGRARGNCGGASRPVPAPGLQRLRARSSDVQPQSRLERLRQAMGNTYSLELPAQSHAQDYEFDLSLWRFGPLLLAASTHAGWTQSRTLQGIRNDQVDHYRVVLVIEGGLDVDSDGRQLSVGPGDMFVSDLSRPELVQARAGAYRTLYVPREMLDEALPRSFDLHGARPGGVAARLLAAQLRTLDGTRLEALAPDDASAIARATVELLGASLVPSSETPEHALPTTQTMLLRQMCRYIDLHLGEPDLGSEPLCSFFDVSRSTLYRMFEPLGGVLHYIRERRLARVHELLATSAQRVHLGSAAQAHGFRSATHFSRAFREQYGYSPGEVRQRGLTATAQAAVRASARGNGLDHWIRGLRD